MSCFFFVCDPPEALKWLLNPGSGNLSSLGCHPQAASAARAESRHHHGFEVLAFHRSLPRLGQLVGALKHQCLQDVASKSEQKYLTDPNRIILIHVVHVYH